MKLGAPRVGGWGSLVGPCLAGLGLALAGCQLAGPGTTAPDGQSPVVLSTGPISAADELAAASLYGRAQQSFEARRLLEALRITAELLEGFPSSEVSGAALFLSARAELDLGAAERADAAAERYVGLLTPDDPRATQARLLQVAAWDGVPAGQLDRLLRVRVLEDGQREGAETTARAASAALSPQELEAVLAGAPSDGPLASIPQAVHASNLLGRGEVQSALELAQAALERGVAEPERSLAEEVVRAASQGGEPPVTSFRIATVLPSGGPPALAEFARQVAEGIEVAAATALGEPYEVTLVPLDDQGDPAVGALLMAGLETESVAGVVGFLEEQALVEAGQARAVGIPILSPTARSTEGAGTGVYALQGPDPLAATSIARYAASRAFQRVAIVLPATPHALEEAEVFSAEAERLGIPIVGRFTYQPGETFFESQIIGAQDALRAAEIAALGLGEEDTLRVEMLEPVGIFLPIPPEDVEYLAPQIAHFALDTLAIELVGTSGWTDPRVLELLLPRYTDGVVATAPVGAGADSPGLRRFRDAYEEYFQRTLVSTTPAIGYDAALLLLEALRPGRTAPTDVAEAMGRLENIEGATGTFSVVDGRVVRQTQVVRIRNRRLLPTPVD